MKEKERRKERDGWDGSIRRDVNHWFNWLVTCATKQYIITAIFVATIATWKPWLHKKSSSLQLNRSQGFWLCIYQMYFWRKQGIIWWNCKFFIGWLLCDCIAFNSYQYSAKAIVSWSRVSILVPEPVPVPNW